MKVNITYVGYKPTDIQKKLIDKFVNFLKTSHPLKDDIEIILSSKRLGHMTTGARTKDGKLKILVSDRLNRDILKTLSHEWMHQYQRTVLGRKDPAPYADETGPVTWEHVVTEVTKVLNNHNQPADNGIKWVETRTY